MASEEIIQAAILQLRSKAVESYGIIKDAYNNPAQEGTADKVAAAAFKMAQYEGAMITLQQYLPNLHQSAKEAAVFKAQAEAAVREGEVVVVEDPIAPADVAEPEEVEAAPAEAEKEGEPLKITEENSPTFKRSQKRRTKKKKADKDSE
jgi:hypothetical protein